MSIKKLFISTFLLLLSGLGFAEGTKEISPTSNNQTFFQLRDRNSYSNFARYGSLPTERLNFTICDASEQVFFGMKKSSGEDNTDIQFRIRRWSDDAIVFTERDVPTSGEGFISNYNRAVAGPNEIAGTSNGYDAYELDNLTPGDYYIEFDTDDSRFDFDYLDITVANASNQAILGRVWSQEWLMNTKDFNNPFEGKLYIYADDGIVTSVDFNGISPYVFNISANPTGVKTTGNFNEDRQSVGGRQTYPQYKVFLNPPDESCFPSGQFGKVTEPITITGCGLDKCINITVDQAGRVLVLLDLNGQAGYQPNSADVQYNVFVDVGLNCIPWDTRDNFGNIIPEGQDIQMQIDYLNGITHLPLYDVENHENGYTVELVRPLDPDVPDRPRLFWDDQNLVPQAGGTTPTTELTGCTSSPGDGCHEWEAAPNFNNGQQDYGNRSTVNTWWYANIITEITGYVVQNAVVDADSRIPGTGADNDTTICSNSGPFQLAGEISFAPSGTWSTSGSGDFSDVNDLTGTYTPSDDDFTNGSVVLTLESDSTNDCPRDQDFLTLNLDPGPVLTLNPGDTVCENNSNISLVGSFSNADGIEWIGGNGTFVPNRNTPNATYNPTQDEIDAGEIQFIFATNNVTNVCPDEQDSVQFYFQQAPEVTLGALPDTLCETTPSIQLSGSVTNAGGGTWLGGNGTFNPSRDSINSVYTPTAAERNSGSLTLTLSSRGETNGCEPVTEDITFTFRSTSSISITAPTIQTCTTTDTIFLSSNVSGNPVIQWSGGSGEFIPSANDPNPQYVVSTADTIAKNITLSVTTDGSDGCSTISDDVDIEFTSPPNAQVASPNALVCANNSGVDLGGTFNNAQGTTWIGGGGSFNPSPDSLNATYFPSQAEIDANFTFVTLTTTGNGFCAPATSVVNIVIAPEPTAEANGPYSICANNPTVQLNGESTNANSTYWNGGTGTYDDTLRAQATYTASPAELSAGTPISLTFNANQDPICNVVSDVAVINILPEPTVEAGPAISICANNATAQLNGSFTGATEVTWSGGQGNFSDVNDIASTYVPSQTEIDNGTVTLTLTTTDGIGSCNQVSDDVTITITPAPIVEAGPDQSVCRNNARLTLDGSVQNATGGVWSGGNRNVSPNNNTLDGTYNPNNQEKNNGGLYLYLTSTGNGNCNAVMDSMFIEITDRARISSFSNNNVCADDPSVTYNPSLTVAGGGIWSGGNGTYTPDNATLNMTYTPSQDEINSGQVRLTLTTTDNGNCREVSFSRNINIDPAPIVDAGADQTICGSETTVQLNGSVQNVGGGRWTSLGSSTSFSSNTDLNATFSPDATDIANGEVEIVLTTTNNGRCNAISDTMKITFSEVPQAEAGNGRNLCTTEFPIALNASGSTGSWVGGTGTFDPSRNVLNATYTPTTGEVGSGNVTLSWVTNVTGSCPQVSDDVTYTLQEGAAITVDAGQTLCGNVASFDLNANVQNAGNAFWTTTGSGDIGPSPGNNTITYTPSPADTSMSDTTSIIFYAATVDNLGCPPAEDSLVITFAPATIVSANADQTICADGQDIVLNGSSLNTSAGVQWTGGNGGTFNPDDAAATTYTPNATDLAQTTLTFVLTSGVTSACTAVRDTTIITLEQGPTTNVGPDLVICGDSSFVNLNASTTSASVGLWTTSGTGSFSPTATDTTTSYYPSEADTALGQITLKFVTQGSGVCIDVADSLILDITDAPILFAGNDTTVCSDSDPIQLNGRDNGVAGSVTWSSSGDGTFLPNENTPNATYTLSANDITNTIVALTFSSNGSGNCRETSETINVSLLPLPTIDAGLPQTLCVTDSAVSMTATITNAEGVTWSTLSDGLIEDDTLLSTRYGITSNDTTAKQIQLVATTRGTGICNTYTDTTTISLQDLPTVEAGPNQEICGDFRSVPLSGTVVGAGGVEWSTNSDGLFSPNVNDLNASYNVTDTDTTNGSVRLFLTSVASGVCPDQLDSLDITVTDVPFVNVNEDTTVCANIDSVAISGTVSVANGGQWLSSGSGRFSPSDTTLNAFYIPSAADTAAGQVTITLSSTGNGTCNSVTSDFVITFTPAPIVDAGPGMTICADSLGIQLRPNIANVESVVWRTSGTGVFGADTTVLSPIYYPSGADTASQQITLSVFAQGGTGCLDASDETTIDIIPEPSLTLSDDAVICFETNSVALNANFQNTSGGQWTSTGGNFSPSAFDSNVSFEKSTTDTNIVITFTTQANAVCPPISDSITITVLPEPTVNAGDDITFCADIEQFIMEGTVTNAQGGVWSTSGEGFILPNDSSLTADYAPSDNDRLQDSIVFSLTTYDTTGCQGASDQRVVYFTPIPVVNAGSDINICPGIASILLNGDVTVATGGIWENITGNGTFSDDRSVITTYNPDPAEAVDGNTVTVRLTSTGNGDCDTYFEDIDITFTNTFSINAGPSDTTICDTDFPIQLNGTGAQGVWSGGLGGDFLPNAQTMDAIYVPSSADSNARFVSLTLTTTNVGTCTPASDNILINFIDGPTVEAGPDMIVCTNETEINLTGNRNNTTSTLWSATGNGSFDGATFLSPTYSITEQDKSVGFVNFTLISLDNGTCSRPSDQVKVTLKPGPSVDPGSAFTLCANATEIQLNGSIENATGATWSGGSNNFLATSATLDARYQIQTADTAAGFVTLTLTTNGHPDCNPETADVTFNFDKLPTSTAGPAQTICANVDSVRLSGVSTNASSRFWSVAGGDGVFSPLAQQDTVTYFLGENDLQQASLTFTYNAETNNNCPPSSEDLVLTIDPAPEVDAGATIEECENIPSVTLAGTANNTSSILWTSTGSGSFLPDSITIGATYLPDSLDIVKGAVNIELRATDPDCNPVSDFTTINFVDLPTASVNAGVDLSVCSDVEEVQLQGAISSARIGKWSTSGSGDFLPNDSTLNAIYVPTPADTTAGLVYIRLTAIGNTECGEITDSISLTFTDAPTADLGGNITVCEDTTYVPLNASLTVASGVEWLTSGTGTFSPNRFDTAAAYIPTATDMSTGTITLSVRTTGNGTCQSITEAITLSFTPAPTIEAGIDQVICETTSSIDISGSMTVTSAGIWSTSGDGNFGSATSNATTYSPDGTDASNGLVVLTFTTTDHGQCKPVSDQLSLTFEEAPTINAGQDLIICEDNSSVQVAASGENFNTVSWTSMGSGTFASSGSSSTSYNLSSDDLNASTVQLEITAAGSDVCPEVTDDLVINLVDAPEVTALAGVLCELSLGVNTTGTITSAQGGQWTTAGTGSFSPSTVELNGTYFPSLVDAQDDEVLLTLTSTGNGLCQAVATDAVVEILPVPEANAGPDVTTCRNSDVTLSAEVEDGISYEWQETNGTVVSNGPTFTVTAATDLTYVLVASRADGCSSSDEVNIYVYDLPTIELDTHHCFTDTLMITAIVTNMPSVPGTFQWYRDGVIIQNENSTDHIVKNTGTYVVEYAYGNCAEGASTEITPLPELDSDDQIGCRFGETQVSTTEIDGATYAWSSNNNFAANGNPASVSTPLDSAYFVVDVTNSLGCLKKDSLKVIGVEQPVVDLADVTACDSDTVTLDATPTNLANLNGRTILYAWFIDNINQALADTTTRFRALQSGEYVATATIGQCVGTDTADIGINESPRPTLADEAKFCLFTNETLILDAGPGTRYLWSTDDTTRRILIADTGRYTVTVTNEFNCSANDTIYTSDLCKPEVFPPTGFFPGQEGPDQFFQIFGHHFRDFNITIYNRWGEVIYFTDDVNQPWDGYYRGELMPIGVYAWKIRYRGYDIYSEEKVIEGSVTVVR